MIRRWLTAQLVQGLRPHEMALAVAVGGACAFFPIVGLATPLCVAAAGLLRLNQAVVQAVNAISCPFYPALVVLFVRIGAWASRTSPLALDPRGWPALARLGAPAALAAVAHAAAQALIGWAIVAAVWLPLAYWALRPLVASWRGARRLPAPHAL